jgi:hypothetical protein
MEMTAPEKNLYHGLKVMMLTGSNPIINRSATYTNLDAGTYTFRIEASNHHGVWVTNVL